MHWLVVISYIVPVCEHGRYTLQTCLCVGEQRVYCVVPWAQPSGLCNLRERRTGSGSGGRGGGGLDAGTRGQATRTERWVCKGPQGKRAAPTKGRHAVCGKGQERLLVPTTLGAPFVIFGFCCVGVAMSLFWLGFLQQWKHGFVSCWLVWRTAPLFEAPRRVAGDRRLHGRLGRFVYMASSLSTTFFSTAQASTSRRSEQGPTCAVG